MLLKPAPVSTDRFSWFRDTRQFVAEISDFGPHWCFGRVWDDAADEGLTLVSAKLWRRYRANYRYLFYLTRSDIWTGAVLMPGSRAYAQLRELRREVLGA